MPNNTAPEAPVLIAPLRRRLLAMIYDGLLLMAILFCVVMVYLSIIVISGDPNPDLLNAREGDVITELEPVEMGWPIYPITIFVYALFYVYFWRNSGQTLGMRAWKIKLVSANYSPPDTIQCLQRLFWGAISFLLFGMGYWLLLFDREKGTLHDRLSSTKVIQLTR